MFTFPSRKIFTLSLLILVLLAYTSCNSGSNNQASAGRVSINMDVLALKALYPDLITDTANSDRFIRSDRVGGLDGRWTYYVHDGKLRWYVFNAGQSAVDRAAFERYLRACEDIVSFYGKELGQPYKVRQGIREYRDPVLRPHNGYLVEQASWEKPEGRLTVDYTFLGEHRSYSLMLSIQVTKPQD